MFEALIANLLVNGGSSDGSTSLSTVVVNNGCGGCQPTYYAYPAYGYYDPYGYAYYPYGYYGGYYAPGYYYATPVYYYAEAPAPALSGTEGPAAVQLSGTEGSSAVDAVDAKVAGTAPTTHLVADDFVWTKGYGWYTDTPGQYPDSKWAWYYDQGGLYDQRHELALLPPGAAGPTKEGKSNAPAQEKPANATPGHLLLCGHALVLGAVDATTKAVTSGKLAAWVSDFQSTAKEGAQAATPVAGFIMSQHVLKEEKA